MSKLFFFTLHNNYDDGGSLKRALQLLAVTPACAARVWMVDVTDEEYPSSYRSLPTGRKIQLSEDPATTDAFELAV